MTTLSNLFGSDLRVRMMRLFLFNPERQFDVDQIIAKSAARSRDIEKEGKYLVKIGLARQVGMTQVVMVKKGKKVVAKKVRVKGFALDPRYRYAAALTDFFLKTQSLESKAVVRRIEKAGRIKAVLVSGIFTGNVESRLDLFVVGDNVKTSSMDRVVRSIESDMGKDIRYAVLSAPDFAYRKSMNDKLIRDVIDYPHTVLLDRIGVSNVAKS